MKQIGATGLPLGLFPSSSYTINRLRLEPGDSLILYADGISEARDIAGNEFGIESIAQAAKELHGASADQLVSACRQEVDRFTFGGTQSDDQTLMAIHFEGEQ